MLYKILNIILLGLWFVLIALFLRKIIFPEFINEYGGYSSKGRRYIVSRYVPFFMLLVFVTVVYVYFL